MSNSAHIDVEKCENVVTKAVYYRISAFDNYNTGDVSIEEDQIPQTDIDALQYCIDNASDMSHGICDIVDSLLEYQKGVTINGTFYDWDEIKGCFGIENEEEEEEEGQEDTQQD